MPILRIGFDDTDSKDGMCTTYIGAVVVDRLKEAGVKLVDFPHLIRLNPNVEWKTRGNCAISMSVEVVESQVPIVKRIVLETIQELAELHHETTNPGVAFYSGASIPAALKAFSKRVVQEVVTMEEAEGVAEEIGAEIHKFKVGRGIIGALAAIGETLEEDRTFELIAYRVPQRRGRRREVDERSVLEMDRLTYPETFDNIDPATGEVRITPHTPCPVLYGIRAENPEAALKAFRMVKALEPIERYVIYETNQATDVHLREMKIAEVRPKYSAIVKGVVSERPIIIAGGHIIFKMKDESGEIHCAAYEPTRGFRSIVKELMVGDVVKAYGGVKKREGLPLTLNLEKIEVLKLNPMIRKINPACPTCGKRMKSAGRRGGYVCKGCRERLPKESAEFKEIPRRINLGLYEVPPRARRHLAKPLIRAL